VWILRVVTTKEWTSIVIEDVDVAEIVKFTQIFKVNYIFTPRISNRISQLAIDFVEFTFHKKRLKIELRPVQIVLNKLLFKDVY
jgi:hypothetical protein